MIKFLFTTIVILALAYFGLGFMGYEIHPENISYYLPAKADAQVKQDAFTRYVDTVKTQNKIHPLIARTKDLSAGGKLDEGSTNVLKQLMQVDKF